jgi:uncharacterized protein YhaN
MAPSPLTLRVLRELKEKTRLAVAAAESYEIRQAWLKLLNDITELENYYTSARRLERRLREQ